MFLPPVLDQIHARAVIIPPYPGLFSALGLLSTDLVFGDQRSAYLILDEGAAGQIDQVYEQMERNLLASIESDPADLKLRRTFDAQLVGQTWDTPFVEAPAGKIGPEQVREMIGNFHDAYEARWGNRFEAIPVQGVTYRVQAVREAPKVDYSNLAAGLGDPKPDRMIELRYISDEPIQAGEYQRDKLGQGDRVKGPAIIREGTSTIQVAPRQLATVGLYGEIVITREEA
jgi:N-methylhydantoinase A